MHLRSYGSAVDVVAGVSIGSATELRKAGCLVGKAGESPVVVFWDGGRVWAIEDRCPHMGFPLHRGTVHDGLLTCHWHHARFDLSSGSTLDLWADDAVAFEVAIEGDEVRVSPRPQAATSSGSNAASSKVSRKGSRWWSPRRCMPCSHLVRPRFGSWRSGCASLPPTGSRGGARA